MPGRTFNSTSYRYGFNGKENDPESVSTGEGLQDYGMRIYNPSLGKFLSVDLLTKKYPMLTPYQFASNQPIHSVDIDGLEADGDLNPTEIISNDIIYSYKVLSDINDSYNKKKKWYDNALTGGGDSPPKDYMDVYEIFRGGNNQLAARNFIRYLEGKGGVDIYSYSQIKDFSMITVNNKKMNAQIKVQLAEFVKDKAAGYYKFDVHNFTQAAPQRMSDSHLAHGTTTLYASGTLGVNINKDGTYSVYGKLNYTWVDLYDYPNTPFTVGNLIGLPSHKTINQAMDYGAAYFQSRAYYSQTVYGTNGTINTTEGADVQCIDECPAAPNLLPNDAKSNNIVNDFRQQ